MKKLSIITVTFLLLLSGTIFSQQKEMSDAAAKLYNDGNSQIKSGNYAGALEDYNKALAVDKDYRIYYQIHTVYKKQRKFDEAEDALKKCIAANPSFDLAYNALGTTYYSMGKFDLALENFEKFKEMTKEENYKKQASKYIGLAYTKLGDVELKDKHFEKGVEYLEKAVANYNYDAAYLKLADAYIQLGKYEDALKAADNAINYRAKKSEVSQGAAYYYKGLAFKGLNEKEKAKENFKIASSDKTYREASNHEIKYLD